MAGRSDTAQVAELFESARRQPGTEQGIACAGTRLESRTLMVSGKAFAFFAPGTLRLKLRDSLAEARALAAKSPDLYEAGASGWVRVTLGNGPLPRARLRRWLDESRALFAPPSGSDRTSSQRPARRAAPQGKPRRRS